MHLIKTLIACGAAMSLIAAPAFAAKQPAKDESVKAAKSAKKEEARSTAGQLVAVKPPSGQWEPKPPAAEGWVWSAGYYEWKDERFQWKAGEWILDRPGFDYRQHEWVQKGDKYQLIGGDWVKETAATK